jgi:5-hydroxyisourate hydrolase-like protein (transthyretin family)
VTVRAVDESGAAVEGVRVVVEDLMDMGTFGFGVRELEGRAVLNLEDSIRLFGEPETDAGGSASLLQPDRTRISVSADDVRHRWSEPVDITPRTEVPSSIVLRPGGGITGLVSDAESGEPAAGIQVLATSAESPPGSRGLIRYVAESGPDGRYLIPGARPGVYSVRQVGGPVSDRLAVGVLGVRVEAGTDATADLELIPARTVSGVLVSEQDGQPMPGIQLGFGRRDGGPGDFPRSVETDEAGRFSISVMPGDTWISTIAGEHEVVGGFRSLDVPEDHDPEFIRLECRARPNLITLTVPERRGLPTAGEVGHFAVNLAGQLASELAQEYWEVGEGHRVIRGRVVDPSGQPVAGAYVWNLQDQQRDADGRVRGIPMDGKGATTDRQGIFILDDQPEGELTLGVWRLPVGVREEVVARGVDEVEFTLPVRR